MNIRSTFRGRFGEMNRDMQGVASELSKVQEQAITGRAVTKASDAPATAGLIARLQAQQGLQQTYQDNATQAESRLDMADSALGNMSNLLSEVRSLVVQLGSETYDADARAAGAAEVDGMFDQAVGLANTAHAGRSLFAGQAIDADAFDDSGTYQGSSEAWTTSVSDVQDSTVGWVGSDVFQGDVDVFATLGAVRDALAADDPDAAVALLEDLDTAASQVDDARSLVGIETNLTMDAGELAREAELLVTTDLSEQADADMIETYTRLNELQTAMEAALSVVAKASTQASLFDRI